MLKNCLKWIDDRTSLVSGVRHFLDEDIPASAGWHQVFGSVALFAFLIQLATGLLLAVNYAPTPGEAHASIRYIMTELTAGPFIRGLHHWGSSCMIVVVVVHMAQVLLWGAYKKPREATWILGCLLLIVTLAFGLTGYLLPWDNRAYWGTMVTTRLVALAPLVGDYLKRLLGAEGGSEISVVTFARFYTAHVVLLPLITVSLIAFHLFLVRKHGVTPAPGDEALPTKKFYPGQVFRDTVATFGYVIVLALMANFAKIGLGAVADPTDTAYIPRPEWYFLFLFQLLKSFTGPLEVFGAVVLPNLALVLLILVPFIDRGKALRVQRRTAVIALVVLGAIGWGTLTQRAVATTPRNLEDPEAGLRPPAGWRSIPAEELAAVGYLRESGCANCHILGRSGRGPDLAKEASTRSADWLMKHFTKPSPELPETQLSAARLRGLVLLVTRRDDNALDAWAKAPPEIVNAAMVYQSRGCGGCHLLNGAGGKLGPPLNGLAGRRTRDWVMGHFRDPRKFVPDSTMPAFQFSDTDLARLTDYLMAVPK